MAKTKIAFDIGNNSMKIAVVKRDEMELHEIRLPQNMIQNDVQATPSAFAEFLKKQRKERNLPKGPAGMILPPSQAICRLVTMPRMTQSQLLLNLPYEFSEFIQGEPEQYYCDYALCETPDAQQADQQMTMMAAAVSKETVYGYGGTFARAGFSMKAMLPQEMALIELVKAYRKRTPNAPKEFCFVDLGYTSTRIAIINQDYLSATRQVELGGRDLDEVVADLLNVDVFLSDTYKRSNHLDVLNNSRCLELYERTAVETLKVINFYSFTNRQSQLDGIYLIGGSANIPALRQIFADVVGMPILDAAELVPGKNKDPQLCHTALRAVGMALAEEG